MALGPELVDTATEEPELDAELDEDAQVAEGQALEDRERRSWIVLATILSWEGGGAQAALRQEADRVEHSFPVLVLAETQGDEKRRLAKEAENVVAQLTLIGVEVVP
jgi:hypothetical protein